MSSAGQYRSTKKLMYKFAMHFFLLSLDHFQVIRKIVNKIGDFEPLSSRGIPGLSDSTTKTTLLSSLCEDAHKISVFFSGRATKGGGGNPLNH